MSAATDPILVYLPWDSQDGRQRIWRTATRITERFSEGYPTGELALVGVTWDDLRGFADWAIGLPPELYAHVEGMHRAVERVLVSKEKV